MLIGWLAGNQLGAAAPSAGPRTRARPLPTGGRLSGRPRGCPRLQLVREPPVRMAALPAAPRRQLPAGPGRLWRWRRALGRDDNKSAGLGEPPTARDAAAPVGPPIPIRYRCYWLAETRRPWWWWRWRRGGRCVRVQAALFGAQILAGRRRWPAAVRLASDKRQKLIHDLLAPANGRPV